MAFSYHIDPGRELVTIVGGDAPFGAWQQMMLDLIGDPGYRPGFRILADHRGVRGVPTPEELFAGAAFVERHRTSFDGCRWALVVSQTISFGMGRVAAVHFAEIGVRMQVFWDVDAALGWLGVDV